MITIIAVLFGVHVLGVLLRPIYEKYMPGLFGE